MVQKSLVLSNGHDDNRKGEVGNTIDINNYSLMTKQIKLLA